MADTPPIHQGSCHCGRVRFEVRGAIEQVIDCNCSACRRKGALWHRASDETFRILAGEADLVLYQFNTMTAKHYFCRHCGIHPFIRPRLAPQLWAFNVRCIDGVDLDRLTVQRFDGANWEAAAAAFRTPRG
ncbi:MAG: GFA family protein [Deltaproteobacteria bacterium]|nr:GFA family protein [Deltaproteobacteria bacterium]